MKIHVNPMVVALCLNFLQKGEYNRLLTPQAGVTLIELLLSLVIGSLLVVAIINTLLATKEADRFSAAVSDLEERARIAMQAITRELGLAGYRYCAGSEHVPTNNVVSGLPEFGIELLTPGGSLNDVVRSTRVSVDTLPLHQDMASRSANVDVSPGHLSFANNDFAFITDCQTADIFEVTNQSSSGGGTSTQAISLDPNGALSTAYRAGSRARVMKYNSTEYLIRDTGRLDTHGNPVYALVSRTYPSTAEQELVEGIDRLRIVFGKKYPNGNISYGQLTDPNIARVAILVSGDPVLRSDDTRTYTLAGQSISPGTSGSQNTANNYIPNKRIKYVYERTVEIMNVTY